MVVNISPHRNSLDPLQLLCALLNLLPLNFLHCPAPGPLPSPDGYTQTFSGLDGATQAGDYLTYGLVDTVAREWPCPPTLGE